MRLSLVDVYLLESSEPSLQNLCSDHITLLGQILIGEILKPKTLNSNTVKTPFNGLVTIQIYLSCPIHISVRQ